MPSANGSSCGMEGHRDGGFEGDHDGGFEGESLEMEGLLPSNTQKDRTFGPNDRDWRAYWLGCGLFLVLFSFWILDTL